MVYPHFGGHTYFKAAVVFHFYFNGIDQGHSFFFGLNDFWCEFGFRSNPTYGARVRFHTIGRINLDRYFLTNV